MMHATPSHSPDSSQQLVFAAIVLPLLGDTYQTARRFAPRHDDASDLTQDALLRALEGFTRFTPGTNARAWLRTIVRTAFLTSCRRQRRQVPLTERDVETMGGNGLPGNHLSPGASPSEADAAETVITDPRIRRALERLPPNFRAAVWLVDIEDLAYDEAAAAIGCPRNTLKSRLFRGRRLLACALADYAQTARLTPRGAGHVTRHTPPTSRG